MHGLGEVDAAVMYGLHLCYSMVASASLQAAVPSLCIREHPRGGGGELLA